MISFRPLLCSFAILTAASCGPAAANDAAELMEQVKRHIAESNVTLECDVTIKRHFWLEDKSQPTQRKVVDETEDNQKLVLFVKQNGKFIDIGPSLPMKGCEDNLDILCFARESYPALDETRNLVFDKITGKVFYQESNSYKTDKATKTIGEITYRLYSDTSKHSGYCRKRDFKTLF